MEKLKRNSYVMYFNVSEAALDLPDKDYKEFGKLIHNYVFYGIEPETDNLAVKMLLKVYLPTLNDALAAYDKRATGNNGGRKKKPQETIDNHSKPQETTANPNNNVNVNVNENGNVNDTVTPTTSNVYNQSIHEIEKEKIEDTVTRNTSNHPIIPIFKNKEIPKMNELLLEYRDNEGELREPTHDELLCVAYIEDLGFSKDDFKDNNYTNVNQIILAVSSKVGKTLLKHGFKVSIDNKDYLDMLKNYLDANYNYFKISTSCF